MAEHQPGEGANPGGNERLTAAIGVLVLAPVVVEIATVLLGVHTFMSLHVFVGLALIPAVLLKLTSTGWRFARYYTRNRAYIALGPPQIVMRVIAPLFVTATVALFGSGIGMGILQGSALQIARRVHGPASAIWLALLGLHVLVYVKRALIRAGGDLLPAKRTYVRGTAARICLLAIAVICGLALGGATVPSQHRWITLPHDRQDDEGASVAASDPFLAPRSGSSPMPLLTGSPTVEASDSEQRRSWLFGLPLESARRPRGASARS